MLDAFLWWLAFLLLGLAALPVATFLFRGLPDRGYAFSRALGLLLFSYTFWILGTVRIVPNSRAGALAVLLLLVAGSAWVFWRRRRAVVDFVRRRRGLILATEAVFAAVFALWGLLRSYSPEIAHTEQPMDFALLNGILASPHFPPNDPWYAGEPITYYYFGYLMTAGMTHVTGITPAVTYNLALASTAAMAAAGVFSLVYNVVASMRAPDGRRTGAAAAALSGVAAVALLLFMGNLVGALEFLQANDVGSPGFWSWVSVDGLTGTDRSSTWYPNDTWWWWRSTRVINTFVDGRGIDYTITEFPFFSFMLGDLHPHVMALPFMVLAMGLALNVLRSPGVWRLRFVRGGVMPVQIGPNPVERFAGWWLGLVRAPVREQRWDLLLSAIALGALGFLNSWDLPTFTALLFAALLLRALHLRARGVPVRFRELAGLMGIFVVAEAVLYIPFYLFFDSQASGILAVRQAQTRQLHYFLVLGPLLVPSVALLAGLAWETFREPVRRLAARFSQLPPQPAGVSFVGAQRAAPTSPSPSMEEGGGGGEAHGRAGRAHGWLFSSVAWAFALPLTPFVLWALVELGLGVRDGAAGESLLAIGSRFWHLLPVFLVLGIGLAVLFRKAGDRQQAGSQFALLLVLFAVLATLGAELFRIADLFNNRMNTVFKFYYQAWVMLAVAGAVGLYYWGTRRKALAGGARWAWGGLMALFMVLIAASFLYVPAAAYAKASGFEPSPTLNGLRAYQQAAPAEYEAVQWLRRHARRGAVIAEAVPVVNGVPQGDYDPAVSRISRTTGLPTVLGWPGHEHQWRGDPFDPIGQRALDVETIYRGGNLDEARRLLQAYDVEYVVVGDLERRLYGQQAANRFTSFMDIAFQNEGVVIYRRRAT